MGASIPMLLLLYMLSQINFIPIIGDWAREIAAEVRVPGGNARLAENVHEAECPTPEHQTLVSSATRQT